jgi:hypothetical protein
MDLKRVRAEGENEAKKTKKQKHGAVVSFYCPTAQSVVWRRWPRTTFCAAS